ncbi:NUDIX domain-containing protein [Streptomyces sp. NPDC002917]|uniref:NUDIX domain-containing protein n=1 Tax=Streptomyces sp. NPDC002917 TaxID=3364671 RepID=UPI00369D106F
MAHVSRLRPASSALVVKDDQVLMVTGDYPWPNCWALPGGGQDVGETMAECVVRELLEETGVRGRAVELMRIREYIPNRDPGFRERPSGFVNHRLDALFWVELLEEPATLGGHHLDDFQTGVEWVPLAKAADLLMVPTTMPGELADMVRSYQAGTWTFQYVGHTL